jgi:Retroviral aspartyl protease.
MHPREFITLDENVIINQNNNLIYVNSKFQNSNLNILLDTGSEASLISQSIVEKFQNLNQHIIKVNRLTLVGPNNKKLYDVNKMLDITLELNNHKLVFQLLIVPNLTMDIVLGSDYLNKYKAKLDYENRKLCINDIWVDFKEINEVINMSDSEQGMIVKEKDREMIEVNFCSEDD